MSTPFELKSALADVRKAYRLVYAYQRRVFDLVGAAAEPLEAAGFEFERWEPALFVPPARHFYKPDMWAWDFLPAYHFWAAWNRHRHGDARRVVLAVNADTGFERKRGEPDPADFLPAEKSHSELWATFIRTEHPPAWDRLQAALATVEVADDGQEHEVDVHGVRCRVRRMRIDLGDLVDEATVDRRLLQPVRAWLG